jgi:AraC-like DNA-binding protein/NAD(P)H-dependent FMN reductase
MNGPLPTSSAPISVLLVAGSRAETSRTRALLNSAASALSRHRVGVDVCDLSRLGRPAADGTRFTLSPAELRSRTRRADAFVLATPTYHGSFSGVIKHWLDQLERHALAGKPVGLMATCGGMPTAQALDHLRVVVRTLGATAVPAEVVAMESSFRKRDDGFEVTDALLSERVRQFAEQLIWFSGRFRPDGGEQSPGGAEPEDEPAASAAAMAGALRLQNGDFPDQIMRAVEYIRKNFARGPLSLDEVAREAYMSRYHFSRTFKRETGTRFIDFLTTVRLAEACGLLARTNHPITTISFAVGYRDLSHFERTFKRVFGHTPTQYRERVRRGLEVPPQLPWVEEPDAPVETWTHTLRSLAGV